MEEDTVDMEEVVTEVTTQSDTHQGAQVATEDVKHFKVKFVIN